MSEKKQFGKIAWRDLTVPNAEEVRDFYCKVVGWEYGEQSMGDYDDYNIIDPNTREVIAGVCHSKGSNAGIPSQWLMYVTVESLAESLKTCLEMGGKLVHGPRTM